MTATPADLAQGLRPRVLEEMGELVALSTPSGEIENTERAVSLCARGLAGWRIERPACSTPGCAPDLLATMRGGGERRLLLLGHLDTVVPHAAHRPPDEQGPRLYGSGTADMKGGVAMALAVARACAEQTESFAELAVLLVCDEEWRVSPFAHTDRFAHYDACLCFEAGEVGDGGEEGVIVRRKGAGTMRVRATGRASHSGSAPERGRNALLALAHAAIAASVAADPEGPARLTVVPTILRSGETINVVPAAGEMVVDLRADDTSAFRDVLAALPTDVGGVTLQAGLERVWPAMDSGPAAAPLLAAAVARLGRPIVARGRGGASDASHFAPMIPLTIDGLGPRGGGAHTPEEFVHLPSLGDRVAVALALAQAAILHP
jgi:glutamate carboxypeptidase